MGTSGCYVKRFSTRNGTLPNEYRVANAQLSVMENPEEIFLSFIKTDKNSYETWMYVYTSTDGGANWTQSSQLLDHIPPHQPPGSPSCGAGGGVYEPNLTVLENGEIVAVYASEFDLNGNPLLDQNGNYDQVILSRISSDRGQTWGTKIYVTTHNNFQRDGMPSIVNIGSGQLVVYYEQGLYSQTYNDDLWSIRSIKSNDSGVTWVQANTPIFIQNPHQYVGAPYATIVNYLGQRFIRIIFQQNITSNQPAGSDYLYRMDFNADWANAQISQGSLNIYGSWPSIFQSLNGNIIVDWSNGPTAHSYGNLWLPNPTSTYSAWYDQQTPGMENWVITANPSSSSAYADSYVGGLLRGGTPIGYNSSQAVTFGGVKGGPVKVNSADGTKVVSSLRTLLNNNSLEEVPTTDPSKLSSDYYWTWYDNRTPGTTDWVLVVNQNTAPVYYEIRVAGQLRGSGTIQPGSNVTPTFPGVVGGPVEVNAWTDSGKTTPANVIASQRVLSNNGSAFNELPGIPASSLSSHYIWTWYDAVNTGNQDWMMIANPGKDHNGNSQATVTAHVRIGATTYGPYTIAAGQIVTPTFPGIIGGPVAVTTDSGDIITSQRSLYGPSFEEVPGFSYNSLASNYYWTWYDNHTPGTTNWVMVANQNTAPVYYEIRVAGQLRGSGTIQPDSNVTPTFPGVMGGPVQVSAWVDNNKTVPANVMASQRVLWNGYFNELLGKVLN